MCWWCNCHECLPCFLYGGVTLTPADRAQSAKYTVGSDSWIAVADMPKLLAECGSTGHADTCWSVGGREVNSSGTSLGVATYNYTLDDAGAVWTAQTALPSAAERCEMCSDGISIHNMGGSSAFGSTLNSNRSYVANAWSSKTNMTAARQFFSLGSVAVGLMYAFGGENSGPTDTTYEYSTSGNSWATKTALPDVRRRHDSIDDGSDLMSVTGGDNPTVQSTHYLYSVSGDSYTTGTALSAARVYAAPASPCDGIGLLLCGGPTTGDRTQLTTEYDFASTVWTAKTATTIAARYLAGCAAA